MVRQSNSFPKLAVIRECRGDRVGRGYDAPLALLPACMQRIRIAFSLTTNRKQYLIPSPNEHLSHPRSWTSEFTVLSLGHALGPVVMMLSCHAWLWLDPGLSGRGPVVWRGKAINGLR